MPTYLLTWNPKKWEWVDLDEKIAEVAERGGVDDVWSTGSSRRLMPGDRVFLLRQGAEPRGIMASGYVKSHVYRDAHWSGEPRETNYVALEWDHLLHPERDIIIAREELDAGIYRDVYWNTQQSGIAIPDHVARHLERRWEEVIEANAARESA